jgi:membrane protease subunit HflK
MLQEAQGFRDSQVARARGEAGRFTAVLSAYTQAQDVTVRRIYLETMEEIFKRNGMTLVDDRLQGLVPFLPLGEARGAAPTGQTQPRPSLPPAAVAPVIQQQRGGVGR